MSSQILNAAICCVLLMLVANNLPCSNVEMKRIPVNTSSHYQNLVAGNNRPSTADKNETYIQTTQMYHNNINQWSKTDGVDIVVPSGLGTRAEGGDSSSYDSIRRDRDNGELKYMLRSILQNAPWVKHIFVIVNGNVEAPSNWFSARLKFVNRCSYMPSGTCPTRNSHAVLTNLYLFSELSERFILAEDDIFLCVPVNESFFFKTRAKPYVFHNSGTHGIYKRIPKQLRGKTLPVSNGGTPHFWCPMLKSVVREIAEKYPEYTKFVSSHRSGRFSSIANGPNDGHNSQEEDPLGVWQAYLKRTRNGAPKNILYPGHGIADWEADPNKPAQLAKAFSMHPLPVFININDVYSTNPYDYKEQQARVHGYLEKLFQAPKL